MMNIWGVNKKYPALSWWENFMGGHVSILNITIFGANAMNWAVNIRTRKWGYICFSLPAIARFKTSRDGYRYFEWYFYLSPNATPWACTFYRGIDKQEQIRARIRKFNFGHGFNSKKFRNELYALNQKFSNIRLSDYDVFTYGHKEEQ